MEIRFVGVKKEQRRILKVCHVDPMSGYMGGKRTLSRISERFIWPGMVKDGNDTVVLVVLKKCQYMLFFKRQRS